MTNVLEILLTMITSRVISIIISVALLIAVWSLVKFMLKKAKGQ